MHSVPLITLITGAPGSGKSTIVQRVAKRFERCLVIDVDHLREMMRSGLATPDLGMTAELVAQFRRARAAAIAMARINASEGVRVLVDDVCVPEMFAEHYAELRTMPTARVVLLMPGRSVLKERIQKRGGPWDHILVEKIDWVYDYLEPLPKEGWHVLDTGGWTIERTTDEVWGLITRT